MGEINNFEEARQRWIQYDEDTEVLVEYIPKPKLKEELRKAEKTAKLSGLQSADILNMRIAQFAVKGWRKIGDPMHTGLTQKGAQLPFTPENLRMLMEHSYRFSNFVAENATNAHEFAEDQEAKEEIKKD